ncbi:MAG: hypothetical protein AAF480_13320 [Actinomycetota bacterium]
MQLRPGQITALVGGVLILISTFLDWFGFGPIGFSVYEGDLFGFTGIILLLLSLDIIVTTALRAFAPQVNLPKQLLGFSLDELTLAAGFAAFIYGLSISTVDGSQGGTLLAALGGLAVVVGAFLELRSGDASADEPRRSI